MRKNHTKLFVALASALSVLSCSQIQEEVSQNLFPNQFIATLESTEDDGAPETRVSLSSNHKSVTWVMNDGISFISDESECTACWYATTVDQDGKRAQFSLLTGSENAAAKFAVYPHNNLDNRVSGQSLVCWAFENQSGQFKDANVMAAKIVDNTLEFKHVMGIFELEVTDSDVKKIVVEGPGIAGGVRATFGDKDSDRSVTGTEHFGVVDEITVKNVTPGTWYVAVRPGTYAAGSVVISYLDGEGAAVSTVTYRNSLRVGRKDIIAFGDISEHVGLPATLPNGKSFNSYMKSLAGSLGNITRIYLYRNVYKPQGDIEIADDVYMSYADGGISVKTSKSSFVANADCSGMFAGCKSLVTIDGLQNVNTSSTTDMSQMFEDCNKLTTVNLTGAFNTANVTNMSNMFYSCEKIETLDLSHFNTRKVTNMAYMFEWCYALEKVYLGKDFVISDDCNQDETLYGCDASWYGTSEEMESFVRNFRKDADFSGTLKFAIDMGDAGWWSAWNLGADNPEGYGDYYAWGETKTKTNYSWNTYFDNPSTDGKTFTKYNLNGGNTVLLYNDDVASVKWRGKWHIPTDEEWNSLLTNCNWTWTDRYKGTGGCGEIVACKTNGNYIFLPAAGACSGEYIYLIGYGRYWSSSLSSLSADFSQYVYLDSEQYRMLNEDRCNGISVRPVTE